MPSRSLMELPNDTGFRNSVEFALFDVASDKAPTAVDPSDDLTFINGVLNGEVDIRNMAIAVVVANADPRTADDASIKTTVETVWPFFAAAWSMAPRVA